jgi:hypothetical protein
MEFDDSALPGVEGRQPFQSLIQNKYVDRPVCRGNQDPIQADLLLNTPAPIRRSGARVIHQYVAHYA